MAPDPDQRRHLAVVPAGCPQVGRPSQGYRPPGDGRQRPDERHDERDAQHWRCAAGQALWAPRFRSGALQAQGCPSTRYRYPAGGYGRHILRHHWIVKRCRYRARVRYRRLHGDPAGIYNRDNRSFRRLFDQPIQRTAGVGERPRRVCHLGSKFRACV